PKDEALFICMLHRTGAGFAAVAGLELSYSIFREPRCREIAQGIGCKRYLPLAWKLVGKSAVASTMGGSRIYHSWRRQLFRLMLKANGGFQGSLPVRRHTSVN